MALRKQRAKKVDGKERRKSRSSFASLSPSLSLSLSLSVLLCARLYTKKLAGNPKQSHQRRAGKAANARKNGLKTRGGSGRRRRCRCRRWWWWWWWSTCRAAPYRCGWCSGDSRGGEAVHRRKETGRGFQWKSSEGRWRTLK